MARELSIVVTAETQQAEPALERVEARLKGIETQAEKTDDSMKGMETSTAKAAVSMRTMLTVAGVVGAGMVEATRRSVAYTAAIDKGAKAARISTDAYQDLDYVARKNGTTFDVLSKSMFDLDIKLSKGSKTTVAAVDAIGLSVDDLLGMSKDSRFREIATAITDIEDPAIQAQVAYDLLGEAGLRLLPVFRDLAEGAEKDAPRMSAAFIEAGGQIERAWESTMAFLTTRGSQFLAYLTLWPAALANWSTSVSEAMWGVTGKLPAAPGRPNSPLLSAPDTTFDPLNGQSMGFVERTLTQSVQERIRAATRRAGSNVIDVPQYMFSGGTPVPLRGSLGFPGFEIPGLRQNLNFAPYAGMLPAQQNLNFAPYAGSVPMNAPGGGGGSFFGNMFGNVGGGLKSLWQGMSGGGGIGGLLGNMGSGLITGGLSSLLGMGVGLIGKGFGKLFGGLFGGEGKKTNRTRDAWISENFGSVDALREAADKAGFSVERMLSVKKVKDFESEVRKLQGAMGDSEADAQRVGEAMERWGISIDEMGPKFKQTQINDVFKEALDDIRVLTNAGADFNVIAEKMAPQLGAMVHEAIEMGGTVPREMEPILRKMIELGLLTDKNGDKFTELSQIPFAADLNKDFATLISKMDALISRISELPGLFDDATDAANELADAAPGGDMPTRPDTSESAPGFDLGGVAGRDWRQRSLRDTIPAWLRPGEVALTPEQARGGVSVQINGLTVGGGMGRAETAEQVGKAVVAYMERRGVRFGRRVA